MTETTPPPHEGRPEEEKPEEGASEPQPAEEAKAEPYDASTSDEPTYDTSAKVDSDETEEEEQVVEGDHPWPMACHLSVFANIFVCIPFGGLLLPFIIRETKRKEDPEIAYHAKEALNFQINVLPLALLLFFMGCLGVKGCWLFAPALLGFVALIVVSSVYAIIAAMAASEGRRYKYPYIVRVID